MIRFLILSGLASLLLTLGNVPLHGQTEKAATGDQQPVSFSTQVKPLLAARCFGCHQGARQEGRYDMTSFASMLAGGESGLAAIVPGAPEESYLIELLSAEDESTRMPPTTSTIPALTESQIDLVRRWILEGAENDGLSQANIPDQEHPPKYTRQPNVTALDYSSDGKWLAVNGLHEVLLFSTAELANGAAAKRFIGLSNRIESIQFSPDGTMLAASGGNPAEFGEVQVWDVSTGKLKLSRVVSHDTIYGVSWSPDSTRVSFGCTDTTVRVIDVSSGEQVLYQGAHEDWIRDTVFSVDGNQLVSVGRDMTCKLIEVPTQRFIDNITSITPGVLKGGIASVARHPQRDEIVIGGADGIPKVYRMNRITKRVIGDDANLVRLLPEMPGRIQAVDISPNGKRIAAVSSLDGKGALSVYSYEFDPAVSDELKAILAKQPSQWNAQERDLVNAYHSADVRQVSHTTVNSGGYYAVAFHPDGEQVATCGAEGVVRIYQTESATLLHEFLPVDVAGADSTQQVANWRVELPTSPPGKAPTIDTVQKLAVSPETIILNSPVEYVQLVVQAINSTNPHGVDVTSNVELATDPGIVSIAGGLIQPVASGVTELVIRYHEQEVIVPVRVDLPDQYVPGFRRDVNPVLTKLGCNSGTCHGSAVGKMGFKLSLRGYDPVFDLRAFTDDMGSRRTNLAEPESSLMLAKPTAAVPHTGGQLIEPDSKYFHIVREWIRNGARLTEDAPRVVSVELFPKNPVLNQPGMQQQMRLVATWSDGSTRDVTREGFIEVGGMDTAKLVEGSTLEALRRGETPVLGRYEGAFTATTLTVMGEREGFVWAEPETWTPIDKFVASKWQRMKIQPSGLCTDEEFIRRVYLDLTGLPPSAAAVRKFVADQRATRIKRDELIDELVGNDSFVEHWSNKWADLLQVNRKYLGTQGAVAFREWLRTRIRENRPYDEFAYEILTATGSNKDNPAASYYKIHRTPVDVMENTTHLFLATRFNCNKCHDHPFERWTQDQYFETAAWFSQVSLQRDPASGDQNIGGTAVEGAKPLYEVVSDVLEGEVTHDRTRETVAPAFPFDCNYEAEPEASRREQLAAWITSPDNPYFATSYVNRLWGYLMGTGLIEPLDDIRAGNPPTNPQLLEHLRDEFVASGFDVQHIIRTICKSRTYQLSIQSNEFNEDDRVNYSHALPRRLPAEVLFDSIHFVTGSELKIPGVEPGTRATALPDSGARLPSGFLATLGRPARESVCECERSSELQLGSVLALVSGPDVARAISDPQNELARLVQRETDDRKLINEIYLRVLNRNATDAEINIALENVQLLATDHQDLIADRDQRKQQVDQERPKLEQQRLQAIELTTAELDEAIQSLDPELLAREAAREKAITETGKALNDYASGPQGKQAWLRKQQQHVQWHPIMIKELDSLTQRSWTLLDGRSVLLGAKEGKDIYTVLAQTDMTGVSSVRLELLPHESLKSGGPGLAENGNLVLTEFELEMAHPDQPKKWTKLEFESVVANAQQPNYPVANAIDGNATNGSGWAIGNNIGKTSWATFQLKSPLGFATGTLLRFRIHQQYDSLHQIGRFRISLSRNRDIGLGLSESLVAQLGSTAGQRGKDINEQLDQAFRRSDARFALLQKAHNEAKQPLAIDPEIVRLREKLARARQPLTPDSRLAQLIQDATMSEKQLGNSRLTAAQDLTWALINSPSFLFNR